MRDRLSRCQVNREHESYQISNWTQTFSDPEIERRFRVSRHHSDRKIACWLTLVVAFTFAIILFSDHHIVKPQYWPVVALTWRISFVLVCIVFALLALRARTPQRLQWLAIVFNANLMINLLAMSHLYADDYVLYALFDVIIILSIYFTTLTNFLTAVFFSVSYGILSVVMAAVFKDITSHTEAMLFASYFAANVGGMVVAIQQNQLKRRYFAREQQLLALTDQLSKQAYVDALTKLKNRHAFEVDYPVIQKLIKRNESKAMFSFIVIADIDKFKAVNDTYGHDIGDQVLQRFALFLQQSIRPSDLIYRFGGEEFVIVLQSCTRKDVEKRLQEIIAHLSNNPIAPALIPYPVTASFGITQLVLSEQAKKAIARADIALYVAKNNGRNTYSYQTPAVAIE